MEYLLLAAALIALAYLLLRIRSAALRAQTPWDRMPESKDEWSGGWNR